MKKVLITGGSGGLGKTIAKELGYFDDVELISYGDIK